MTETDWHSSTDLLELRDLYTRADSGGRLSGRKARLYAVACLHQASSAGCAGDDRLRAGLGLVERYADGQATDRELLDGYTELQPMILARPHSNPWDALLSLLDFRPSGELLFKIIVGFAVEFWQRRLVPADLLRDVFGYPLRMVTFASAWRTSDVLLLANGIYDDKAFDRMPILADALQDAGCDCDDILNHLRDTSVTHVRGCWALDLVLGKE